MRRFIIVAFILLTACFAVAEFTDGKSNTAVDRATSGSIHINGDNAMTGNLNMGGQDITNAGSVTATGEVETGGSLYVGGNIIEVGSGELASVLRMKRSDATNEIITAPNGLNVNLSNADDAFIIDINNADEYDFDAERADFNHNNQTNVNSIAMSTGGVHFATHDVGQLNGTNGVYWTRNGTNYWMLFGTTD